jgi:aminopeptidase N
MKESAVSVLVLVFLSLGSPARAASASAPEIHVRLTHLELTADLNYEEGGLEGVARMRIENVSDWPADKVPLNLNRLMSLTRVVDGEAQTLSFEQDVRAFIDEPKKQVTHAVVSLSKPLDPGESITLELDYSGYLVGYTETGSSYIRDSIDEEFSILRVDAHAFPSIGVLSWMGNRMAPKSDFTFRAQITVPEAFTVASGGELVERSIQDGRATFTYRSTAPVPFLNLPIARYEVLEEGGLRLYHFPEDRKGAEVVVGRVAEAVELLTAWLGPLGQKPDFAIMEIPAGWGSQAHLAAGIMQTAEVFEDPSDLRELYHELSHLWNAPDLDQPSARWNEGLAMYLQSILAEEIEDWGDRAEHLEYRADRLLRVFDDNPSAQGVPFADYGQKGLTDYSYATGMLLFFVLEELIGQQELLGILRDHYQEHREAGTTFEDLEEALLRGTSRDLAPFLEEWIHTTVWQDRIRTRKSIPELAELY